MASESLFVTVYVNLTFIGFHRWKDAPPKVDYLRHMHRHVFHVQAEKQVTHNERQIEFIQLKEQVQKYVDAMFSGKEFDYSCEDIATEILRDLNLYSCTVSEDGENGARVTNMGSCG